MGHRDGEINDGDLKRVIKSTRRKTDHARIQSSLAGPRTQAAGRRVAVMNRGRCLMLFEFVCRPPGAKSARRVV